MLKKAEDITGFAREIKDAQFQHVVLLGMGGSSLCPEVAWETFGAAPGWPKFMVLDNTDPAAVSHVESQIDLQHTLFIVASKSGTTTETRSFYPLFLPTDEGTGWRCRRQPFCGDHRSRNLPGRGRPQPTGSGVFSKIPQDIGGRYSALSYFGLLPMALMGVDIGKLLEQAVRMTQSCAASVPAGANPGVSLGALLGLNERRGRDKVTLVLSKSVSRFGAWAEQLLAESTGKQGQGLIPVDGEELGKPEMYGNDRVFVSLNLKGESDPKVAKKLQALETAGHPVVRIELNDRMALGAEFVRWEMATAVAGAVIGVNPFDEPNVSESKKNTADLLEEWKQKHAFSEGTASVSNDRLKVFCPEGAERAFDGNQDEVLDFYLRSWIWLNPRIM